MNSHSNLASPSPSGWSAASSTANYSLSGPPPGMGQTPPFSPDTSYPQASGRLSAPQNNGQLSGYPAVNNNHMRFRADSFPMNGPPPGQLSHPALSHRSATNDNSSNMSLPVLSSQINNPATTVRSSFTTPSYSGSVPSTPQQGVSTYPIASSMLQTSASSAFSQAPRLGHPLAAPPPLSTGAGPSNSMTAPIQPFSPPGSFVPRPASSNLFPAPPSNPFPPQQRPTNSYGAQSMMGFESMGMDSRQYPQYNAGMNRPYDRHHHQYGVAHSYPYMQAATPNTENRPYRCDCGQAFSRNHDLKRHMKIHLTVKPFPCTFCHKAFSRKDALKVRQVPVLGVDCYFAYQLTCPCAEAPLGPKLRRRLGKRSQLSRSELGRP